MQLTQQTDGGPVLNGPGQTVLLELRRESLDSPPKENLARQQRSPTKCSAEDLVSLGQHNL